MRISVYPAGDEAAGITLTDTSWLQARWSPNEFVGLVRGGLEGWFSSPQPRVELIEVPQMTGTFWPTHVPLAARVLTIRGVHAVRGGGSSFAVAQFRDCLAALVGCRLVVRVEDSSGIREVEGVLSDSVDVEVDRGSDKTRFTLIISCPDPIKYGPVETFAGSSIVAVNRGNHPVWPKFKVAGKCTRLIIDSPTRYVEWSGNATDLVLDTRYGIPTSNGIEAGTLLADELFSLDPGDTPIGMIVSGGGKPSLEVRPGWV